MIEFLTSLLSEVFQTAETSKVKDVEHDWNASVAIQITQHTSCLSFDEKVVYVVALAETDGDLVLNGMLLFWSETGDGQNAWKIA